MKQNYFVIFSFSLLANSMNAQDLALYRTFGEDTIVKCFDATDGIYLSSTTIWAGTNKGVVSLSDWGGLSSFDSLNSPLPSNEITALDVSNDETTIWVGTDKGLCRYYPGYMWAYFNTVNSSLPSDSITCILDFSNDSVWIGTKNGLVLYLTTQDTFLLFDTSNSLLRSNRIQCLERYYFIPSGYSPEVLYVGTDSGMISILGSQWSLFITSNSGLLCNDIRAIDVSFNSDLIHPSLWIATYGGGVSHLVDTSWSSYTTSNSLIKKDSIDFIDDAFDVDCGSRDDSLYVLDSYSSNYFSVNQWPPIPHPIASVSRHRANGCWLWVSTEHEIYRADRTEGIFQPDISQVQWQATIIRNQLYLFNLPSSQQFVTLTVYDVLGNLILKRQFIDHSSSENFEIPAISNGIYLVTLRGENQIEAVKTAKTE